jgi:hypothetical protein
MSEEKENVVFHSESAITRISMWATIVAWIILGVSLYSFGYTAYNIVSNWDQIVLSLPESIWEKLSIFASQVFFDPLVGVFYFLVLRAVSQGLNLGLDIFYKGEEAETAEAA